MPRSDRSVADEKACGTHAGGSTSSTTASSWQLTGPSNTSPVTGACAIFLLCVCVCVFLPVVPISKEQNELSILKRYTLQPNFRELCNGYQFDLSLALVTSTELH